MMGYIHGHESMYMQTKKIVSCEKTVKFSNSLQKPYKFQMRTLQIIFKTVQMFRFTKTSQIPDENPTTYIQNRTNV